MKTYYIKDGKSVGVTLCMLDGKRAWISKDGMVISSVNELPEGGRIEYDTTAEKNNLGEWLTQAMKESGWKMSYLCKAANIQRGAFIKYQRGEVAINFDTLVKLCYLMDKELPIATK